LVVSTFCIIFVLEFETITVQIMTNSMKKIDVNDYKKAYDVIKEMISVLTDENNNTVLLDSLYNVKNEIAYIIRDNLKDGDVILLK